MTARRALAAIAVLGGFAGWCSAAYAFRPFDGTDAAVAEPQHLEIEFAPIEYLREAAARSLFGPSARLNYGFAPGWEAVVEGRVAHALSAGLGGAALVDSGMFLKHVLREGVLQDKDGPSIGVEGGALLPGIRADRGTGGSLAGILSQRWDWVMVHLNAQAALTRQQHGDVFLGAIVEGPHDWTVRPVAEVFCERDFGEARTRSVLLGAIWQAREDVAVDFGLRGARINDHTAGEIRAGITFAFPIP